MCAATAETTLIEQWQGPSEPTAESVAWHQMAEVTIGLQGFLVFAGLVAAMLAIDAICIWLLLSLEPQAVDVSSDWAFCWCSVFAML